MGQRSPIRFALPLLAGACGSALAIVCAVSVVFSGGVVDDLNAIRNRYVPAVVLNQELTTDLESFQRQLQDAVAAESAETLVQAQKTAKSLHARIGRAVTVQTLAPEVGTRLQRQTDDYTLIALDSSKRMIAGEMGPEISEQLGMMVKRFQRLQTALATDTAPDFSAMEDSFQHAIVSTETDTQILVTVSILITLLITAILTVSLRTIAKEERRFRTVVDRAHAGIFLAKPNGEIELLNEVSGRWVGANCDNLFQGLVLDSDQRAQVDSVATFQSDHAEFECAVGPHRIPVLCGVTAVPEEDGARILVALSDLSDIEEAQREVEDANARLTQTNADLKHFAHIASHDLREPMRRVAMMASIARKTEAEKLSEKGQELLQKIQSNSENIMRDISDFRVLANVGEGEISRQDVPLQTLIEGVLAEFSEPVRTRVGEIHFDDMPVVSVYENLGKTLYRSLIENALHFTEGRKLDFFFTAEKTDDKGWVFGVRNTASTIEENALENIFRPFARLELRSDRSGLGLSVCRRIAERHGGLIWGESGPDFVHFKFTLGRQAHVKTREQDQPDLACG